MKNKVKDLDFSVLKYSPILTSIVIIVFILITIASIIGLIVNPLFGALLSAANIVMILLVIYIHYLIEKKVKGIASEMAYQISRGNEEAIVNMPLGIALYNNQFNIQWVNPKLQEYFKNQDLIDLSVKEISNDIYELIDKEKNNEKIVTRIGDKSFQVFINSELNVIYLYEITKFDNIEKQFENSRIIMGQVFIDNYDEITQNMTDRTRSNLNNFVTNQLTNWSNKYKFYIKRINSDRFLIISYIGNLKDVENTGFNILDTIREETLKQNYPLTLSMGISYGVDDLNELSEIAQSNLDLALGRGGDQVVIKSKNGDARFFGGKTNPLEKRTRVRARMISQALQEIIKNTENIFVMGHQRSDMDSIGSSIGIRKIAKMNGKDCKIIFDENNIHSDVQKLREELKTDEELDKDIISIDQSFAEFTENSLLILVDHSKQSISINPELVEKANGKIVVIDHHRRGEEFPENMMLAYIEPYASSTCELIAELLEYQPTSKIKMTKLEATAMLAGITVDTKSFSLRTGTRTFDAASYLRSIGASEQQVQELLKEDITSFIKRNKLIESLEMFDNNVAICFGDENDKYDPVIAAQAADTLLSLSNINASFVIVNTLDGKISISARSLGSFNVQLVMEKMGGGGHLSNAATQIENSTISDVKEELINILKTNKE